MAERGLEHFKQERDALQLILQMSGQNRSPEGQLFTTLIEAMLETAQKIIAAAPKRASLSSLPPTETRRSYWLPWTSPGTRFCW
jgi:hypothetical protein